MSDPILVDIALALEAAVGNDSWELCKRLAPKVRAMIADGLVLVPEEATENQLLFGYRKFEINKPAVTNARAIYRAMIAARPQAPST